jgi:hypothetical protein
MRATVRAFIIAAATAVSLTALPAGAAAAGLTVPALAYPSAAYGALPSCGDFQSIGTQQLAAGDGINYTLEARDALLDPATTVHWGDGTSNSIGAPLAPGDAVTLPPPPPPPPDNAHRYNNPGTFNLTLTTRGQLPDGSACADNNVPIGTVVVSAPGSEGKGVPAPATPSCPTNCQQRRAAVRQCRAALGRLGRIFRGSTQRRITCRRLRGGGHSCRATWRNRQCRCRYTARLRVPARGRARVVRGSVRRIS